MNKQKKLSIIIPIILFVILTICVQAKIAADFEQWAYSEAVENMSPILTTVMKVITYLGDPIVIIVVCLILFFIPETKKNIALPVSMAVISSAVCNTILKYVFARSRPDILQLISEKGYSFPSGHAMNNAALYIMLILLIWKYIKNTSLKIILSSVCVILIILIGYSRIYLGVHFVTDVLGGWLFGLALTIFVYFLWNNKISNKNA